MDSFDILSGIDMNNPLNLSLYSQLARFMGDLSKGELQFHDHNGSTQRVLHTIADSLGLVYEFSRTTRCVTITRPTLAPSFPEQDVLNLNPESFDLNATSDAASTFFDFERSDLAMLDFPDFGAEENLQNPPHISEYNSGLPIQAFESLPNSNLLSNYPSDSSMPPTPFPAYHARETPPQQISTQSNGGGDAINPVTESYRTNDQGSTRKIASVSSSTKQCKKPRHQNMSNRKPSVQSRTGVDFQEIVFDSSSTRSASQASTGSAFASSPRDSSRLRKAARKVNEALKAIGGACWRCKILRKECNDKTPCSPCPHQSHKSPWSTVGCRRGTLEEKMFKVSLCTQSDVGPRGLEKPSIPDQHSNDEDLLEFLSAQRRTNALSEEALRTRTEEATKFYDLLTNHESTPASESLEPAATDSFHIPLAFVSMLENPSPAQLIPLNECIFSIAWELSHCSILQQVLDDRNVDDVMVLLHSAAVFQAGLETNQLIAQSLICLRACLETSRVQELGNLGELQHRACAPSVCNIKCVTDLESNLSRFMAELSRVFFSRQGMRNKMGWLSIFYSFCIQGLVRRAIIKLMPKATTRESKRPRTSATIAAEQYLYLAVRLFVATSGKNDPLILDFSAAENAGRQNPFETKSYKQARVAVKQEGWLSKGIFNSGDYLQRLFEDSGEIIIEQDEIEKLERGEEEEIPSGHNSSGESGLEKVDPISPGQPSSPRIWTRGTGAARFLFLEPLKKLIARRRKLFFRGAEPIVQEEKRGLLRVFGSGEGYEQPAGYPDCDANSDRSSFGSFGRSSASSFGSFGSNEWGQLGGLTPDGDQSHAQEYNKPDRMPDFDRDTITASVRSYKANIHILHPIISLATLDMLVEGFLRSIPVTSEQAHTQESGSKPQAPSDLQQSKAPSLSNKRKRSPSISEASDTQGYGVWENARPGRPFRTTSTALVLLVIALGQICIHGVRILLPDEIPSQASYQRRYRNPKPNANQSIIPGLSYFALATDIIGNQVGGNSLLHVHVNILAALYHGQLARVLESHAYIHQACRSLQFILTSDFDKFKKLKSKDRHPLSKDNPLLFAFWTCVQLEGEIISELPCPASGLISYEDHVPTPNFTAAVEEGFSVEVIESFRAHLFLRKHLKQVHNMFCAPSDSIHFYSMFSTSDLEYFPTIIAAEANLRSLSILTPNLKWNEDDPPRSILAARLRFEYFSAEVITFQYFLLKIMEHSTANSTDSMNNQTIAGNFKKDISVPAINSEVRTIDDLDPNIQEYAQKCIKALIRCLGAFFALGDPGRQRLIVPNVWVIAHRQWGHVLLLVAAYMDSILQPLLLTLVTKRELYYLVGKTSSFLEMAGDKKAALGIDLNILSLINDVLREGILPNSPLLHDLTSFSQ